MKKMIGKIALSFLLVFAGLCLGETVAGLKSYEGDLVSFVLSSLQADILFLSGVIVIFDLIYTKPPERDSKPSERAIGSLP